MITAIDPMSVNKKLHDLIQALSRSEKRAIEKTFRSNASERDSDEITYVKIYRLLEKKGKVDEEALHQIKNVDVHQQHLMKMIFRIIRLQNRKETKIEKILHQLQDATILYRKGLYKWALSETNKARKIAEKLDLQEYLMMINQLELRFVQGRQRNNKQGSLGALSKERSKLIGEIQKQNRLLYVLSCLLALFHEKYLLQGDFEEQIPWPEAWQEQVPEGSVAQRVLFMNCKIVFSKLIGDKNQQYRWASQVYQTVKAHPEHYELQPQMVLSTLSSIYAAAIRADKFEEAKQYQDIILKHKTRNIQLQALLFSFAAPSHIAYLHGAKLSDAEARKLIKLTRSDFDKYLQKDLLGDPAKKIMPVSLSLAYMYCGDYEAASQCFDQFVQGDAKKKRVLQNLNTFSQLLHLALLYCRKDFDRLLIDAPLSYRSIKASEGSNRTEKLLAKFFSNSKLGVSTKRERKEYLEKLSSDIEALCQKYPQEQRYISSTYSWIEWAKRLNKRS